MRDTAVVLVRERPGRLLPQIGPLRAIVSQAFQTGHLCFAEHAFDFIEKAFGLRASGQQSIDLF